MWGRVHARVEIDGNDVSGKLTRLEINKGQDTSTGALRSAYPAQVSVQLLDQDSEYNILNPNWTELEIGSEVDIDLAIAQSHETAAGGEYAVFDDERLVMGNDKPVWGIGVRLHRHLARHLQPRQLVALGHAGRPGADTGRDRGWPYTPTGWRIRDAHGRLDQLGDCGE